MLSAYEDIGVASLSLSMIAIMLLVALPITAVLGYLTGKSRRTKLLSEGKVVDKAVGETTLGAILALLGLLLAFSFGNALSLAQERKSAAYDEAAALGTAFLRADYLEEPGRTELQVALLAYTKTRIVPHDGRLSSLEGARQFLQTSLEAQAVLWPLTLKATADPLPPPIKTFVASAVNDALDAHLIRAETLSNPISYMTQMMILALALTSLFLLGNRAGNVGRALTWRTFVFSGFLFVVMFSISDTIRPVEGMVTTEMTALKATVFDMEQALDGRI